MSRRAQTGHWSEDVEWQLSPALCELGQCAANVGGILKLSFVAGAANGGSEPKVSRAANCTDGC